MSEDIHVAFIGNPNCGKTTLFNAYTGAHLKVANWPGVTVEKKEGALKYHNNHYKLVDLPGIYSLTSYTMEEKLSRQYILEDEVDIIVDVVDASSLERNLYLALQLIELGKPLIIALNMMDVVEERGMDIGLHRLPEMLGVPVIPVSARKKRGLEILLHAVAHHNRRHGMDKIEHQHKNEREKKSSHQHRHHRNIVVVYDDWLEDKIDIVETALKEKYGPINNLRWYALKVLAHDEEIMNKYPLDIATVAEKSYEKEIIKQKYDFIEEVIEEVLVHKDKESKNTDKIDTILTHRYWGIPIFLLIMAFIFFLTFTIGDFFQDWIVLGIDKVSDIIKNFLTYINVSPVLTSLLVDGAITGVGSILSFLPNIFILFLALAVLEDSGYMSRVAYVMDGIMGKVGLSGRAFIPLLLGFGCSVPAIMASRALENPRDRLKTILITPFMSCSARLPIYILIAGMFFGDNAMYAAFSMYVLGIVVAIALALIFSRIDKNKNTNTLLIELPEYKSPNAASIFIYAWEKVKSYLSKAGTTIFVASLLIWFILHFNMSGMVSDIGQSFGGFIGRVIAPILAPAGLDVWQIAVALLSGVAAKEVVVSSMSILYGVSDISSQMGMTNVVSKLSQIGFSQLNAYALMVFCLLYTPCVATLVTIRKETGRARWALFSVFFQLFVAWVAATIVYQVGSIFFR